MWGRSPWMPGPARPRRRCYSTYEVSARLGRLPVTPPTPTLRERQGPKAFERPRLLQPVIEELMRTMSRRRRARPPEVFLGRVVQHSSPARTGRRLREIITIPPPPGGSGMNVPDLDRPGEEHVRRQIRHRDRAVRRRPGD